MASVWRTAGVLVASSTTLAGCECECVHGGGTDVNRIGIVAGDSQVAFAGTAVFIRPQISVGTSGIAVSFQVTSGGGTVSESRLVTQYDGTGAVSWTLGVVPGANSLTARIVGSSGEPVIFHATGLARSAGGAKVP